jgi:nitrous oxidase accessory protein
MSPGDVEAALERGFAVLTVIAIVALVLASAVVPAVTGVAASPNAGGDGSAGSDDPGGDATGNTDGDDTAGVGVSAAEAQARLAYDAAIDELDPSFDVPTRDGTARVDGTSYESLDAALEAVEPGGEVVVDGVVAGGVTVATPNVTIRSARDAWGVVDGHGEGDVLRIDADGVTLERLWVRNSGYEAAGNDAGVFVDADDVTVADSRVTAVTFGVWVDGVYGAEIANTTIVGREDVPDRSNRGNGIQLWRAGDAYVHDNAITDARDGIYYSWASDVTAADNALWDLRYGVHYMYSDDCTLRDNRAFDNDVGYALMVSQDLTIANNTAVNNTGRSGHGLLVKSIDDSTITGNHLVGNDKGLFVYNSLRNELTYNLVLANDVGVHLTAGSDEATVHHNSFVDNGRSVWTDLGTQVVWNASAGNYWADATVRDVDDDGISEIRHRPAGLIDRLAREHPLVSVFARSPAVSVIELAESRVPLVEAPGVVDRRPLARPVHDWRVYYDRD